MGDTWRDPRTGLPLARITAADHDRLDGRLRGKVVYWFNVVTKLNRNWGKQKRQVMVTDAKVYFLGTGSNRRKLTRCIEISHIKEILVDEIDREHALHVGLILSAPGEYDCCFMANNAQDKADVIRILQAVRQYIFKKDLPLRHVDHESEKFPEALRLQRPPGWSSQATLVFTDTKDLEHVEEQHSPSPHLPPPQEESDRRTIRSYFKKDDIAQRLKLHRSREIDDARQDLEGYVAMIDDRDREIESLKQQYLSLTENPEFWRSCPRCKSAESHISIGVLSAEDRRRSELEKQLEDYRQLIHHLQQSRNGGGKLDNLMESAQVASMRKEVEEGEEKVRMLQKLIIDNPYPTEDVRIRADQIAEGEVLHMDTTPKARELHATIAELQRQFALRDRELRHSRNLMKDAFKRQVDELTGVRQQFQLYDEHIVDYLEKIFTGNAFPQGEESRGQTALQLAQATSQAARQAATPPAFPRPTASVHMPSNELNPFSSRIGSRDAASAINQFVPPNVISAPSSIPVTPAGAQTPHTATSFTGMGRGTGRRSIL